MPPPAWASTACGNGCATGNGVLGPERRRQVVAAQRVQPDLGLRVREVSDVNQKGKHTTTTAELIRLDFGGWVVDTPGVRQFELWEIQPEEVEGFFPEFRPFVHLCGFPDCTHTHEDRCAVKRAVYRRQIDPSRYTSYLGLFAGEPT